MHLCKLKKKMFTVENISYHNLSSDSCLYDLLPNYSLSNLKFNRHNDVRFHYCVDICDI